MAAHLRAVAELLGGDRVAAAGGDDLDAGAAGLALVLKRDAPRAAHRRRRRRGALADARRAAGAHDLGWRFAGVRAGQRAAAIGQVEALHDLRGLVRDAGRAAAHEAGGAAVGVAVDGADVGGRDCTVTMCVVNI